MSKQDTHTKNDRPLTEREIRKDAIDALRQFEVTLEDGTKEYVFAHKHGLQDGTVLFYVDTMDGTFCRAVYRRYQKVLEVVHVDGSQSTSNN